MAKSQKNNEIPTVATLLRNDGMWGGRHCRRFPRSLHSLGMTKGGLSLGMTEIEATTQRDSLRGRFCGEQ